MRKIIFTLCLALLLCFCCSCESGTQPTGKDNVENIDTVSCIVSTPGMEINFDAQYLKAKEQLNDDTIPTGCIYNKGDLVMDLSWDADIVILREDYYEYAGTEKQHIDSKSILLGRDEEGKFNLELKSMHPESHDFAIYSIRKDDSGDKFCFLIEYPITSSEPTDNVEIILSDEVGELPEAVTSYAAWYVREIASMYTESARQAAPEGGEYCSFTQGEVSSLEFIETGTAGLNDSINMYRLSYRIKPDKPQYVTATFIGADGWCSSELLGDDPYLVLYHDADDRWSTVGMTNADGIASFETDEMLEKYGNPYTAAAMEVYEQYKLTQNSASDTASQNGPEEDEVISESNDSTEANEE